MGHLLKKTGDSIVAKDDGGSPETGSDGLPEKGDGGDNSNGAVSQNLNLKDLTIKEIYERIDLNKKTIRKIIKRYRKRYTRYRYSPAVFAMVGFFLISFTFVWNLLILPGMMVIPNGMEMQIELEGKARIINETDGSFSDDNITATLSTVFGESRGDNVDVTQTLSLLDLDTGEDLINKYEGLMESTRDLTVDRRTGVIVEGGSGQMLLPMGNIEKTDYNFFNIDTNSTGLIRYTGEDERSGLDTLAFEMSLEGQYLGQYKASGPVPATDIFVNGNTKYWFEHRTGIPADAEREMELYIDLPNLKKIPDDLVQQRILLGNATLVDMNDTTKTTYIAMMVMMNMSTIRQWGKNGETLVVWENMTGYDADTGEKLPEVYQLPIYERLLSVNQVTAKHVNEPKLKGTEKYHLREGQWMFPFGKIDPNITRYKWFNQITNTTMDCVLQGREDHLGADCYRYRIEGANYRMKPQDSKLENMIMIFDGFLDYWADAETGLIHDTHINFTFSVLSVNKPDDFANKTRLASADISMSSQSIAESLSNLTQARGFFPHSGKRLIVFKAEMSLSEASSKELSDTAGSFSTLLLFGEFVIPYTCAAGGTILLLVGGYRKRKRDIFYLE